VLKLKFIRMINLGEELKNLKEEKKIGNIKFNEWVGE
jgi:hypothetical protein